MKPLLLRPSKQVPSRRGAVAVLLALMIVVVFAFIALGVDIGWATLTKSQLQNAAEQRNWPPITALIRFHHNRIVPS